MADRRKHYERRQAERRKPNRPGAHPIVYVMIGVILASTVYWFYLESETISTNFKDDKTVAKKIQRGSGEYDLFRADVMQRDLELRNKLKRKRASRQTSQGALAARQHYQNRISELTTDYEQNREFAGKKGSIGWDLQRAIQNMKTDAPPD